MCTEDITGAGQVSDAHEQRIMFNGVITPPHDFRQPSRWYYRVQKVAKYEFGEITYGITSIPNCMYILTDIIWLLNAYRRTSQLIGVTK
jgi:hypothetical protein